MSLALRWAAAHTTVATDPKTTARAAEEPQAEVGATITEDGIGAARAMELFDQVLAAGDPLERGPDEPRLHPRRADAGRGRLRHRRLRRERVRRDLGERRRRDLRREPGLALARGPAGLAGGRRRGVRLRRHPGEPLGARHRARPRGRASGADAQTAAGRWPAPRPPTPRSPRPRACWTWTW
ncbi:hypothetical protein [Brachybacterium sp. GPGPB12]|uniref:hypothetical protein n=1 Tax=Brachybacterium sp. GPGPB12 TaxID=3023517 RepID=UPI00313441D2